MNTNPKILAFAGSLREDSYNKKLIKIAIDAAIEAGAQVTYIDLKDYELPLYNQEIEQKNGLPENALKLKKLFLENDGLLIASPEYNSSFSAVLKNTLDWVSRPARPDEVYLSCFIDKPISLMSASPGALGGLRGLVHLRAVLGNVFSIVLPRQKSISNADKAFNAANQLIDAKAQEEVYNIGKELTEFIRKVKK